jgi:PAS domain S-box-containing protein
MLEARPLATKDSPVKIAVEALKEFSMSKRTRDHRAVSEMIGSLWTFLPQGGSLPADIWNKRHRFLLGLAWFHAVVIALLGPLVGYTWELSLSAPFRDGTVLHTVAEGLIVAVFAVLGSYGGASRAVRATLVGFGLISSSAILVHLSGGYIELHFHFFVMLAFLALYQDWGPYILAIVYVAIHHGVVGVLWPEDVYNHSAAFNAPWTWAGIHAFFVLWASVGSIIAWRFNEAALARAKLILDVAGDGIYGLDAEGKITFVNLAAARMLGSEVKDIIGKPMNQVVVQTMAEGSPSPDSASPILLTVQDGTPCRVTNEIFRRKDGTSLLVDYVSNPIFERDQLTGAVVAFRDVTYRKRTEEELAKKAQELARSNAELQHFAYIASHDLQEPLRMVTSYVQLLARRYKGKLDADAEEFIAFAVDGATRMTALINALLAYSRVETKGKEFEPVNCDAVVDSTLTTLQAAIAESKAVVSRDPLPTVMADATQLGQLFQNLIGNGIKFRGVESPRIHVSSERNGKEWIFSVRDHGIGIDPQYADRIFVMFQRLHTKGQYPGTGIGLALCKKIVERHGGRIWVESQPGHGATFYFTVPQVKPDREEERSWA